MRKLTKKFLCYNNFMSDFSELIKNFDGIRDSLRNFFIFGYVKRSNVSGRSARSYDNELRRIKSWLKDIIKCQTSANGKMHRAEHTADLRHLPR